MNNFEEEIRTWLDADGLIGDKPFPEKWSTGNALLETAFAYQAAKKHNLFSLMLDLENAAAKCFENGVLNKNPNRSDQITHDCIIGFASINTQLADLICRWGEKTGWVLSNTGEKYFTAYVKPHHKVFYLDASSIFKCDAYLGLFFWLYVIAGILVASNSGARLYWLMVNTRPPALDFIFKPLFDYIFKRRFHSINNVNKEYYGKIDHINVKYL